MKLNIDEVRSTIKMYRELFIVLFWLSAIYIVEIQTNCKAVINEVNISDTRKPGTREFVELKSTCEENLPLRGYKTWGS